MKVDAVNLQNYYNIMAQKQESGPAEVGFVEGLFELQKVRCKLVRARSEISHAAFFILHPQIW